jgi:ankyrin repeat protein
VASQSLIDHGARVDSVNHKGGSALLYALVTHSYDLVPLLIKSGARWQETDAQGRSILTRLIETNTSNLERCLDSFPSLIDVPECEYDLFPVTRAIELN